VNRAILGSAGGGSSWTQAAYEKAVRYLGSVERTYGNIVAPNVIELYGYGCVPGLTPAECSARLEEAALYRDPAVRALRKHVAFMKSNPAAVCFRDAYAADRRIAARWLHLLSSDDYATEITPEGQVIWHDYDDAFNRMKTFLRRLTGYMRDCG
jgi:hypothetical protein